MADATVIQTSFVAGELSPLIDGRIDIARYYNGAKTLENCIVLPYGGVTRRPGTYYVLGTKTNQKARLIAFQFSTTQAYILEFTNLLMRVYKDQGVVLSGANPYELVTPYLEADLFKLQFAQDADTMFITHPSYKPRELTRTGHAAWTLKNYAPELMTLDVAPGGAGWAVGDTITGNTSGKTCEIVSVTDTTHYRIKNRTGAYTLDEILTNGTDTADQGAAYPTTTGDPFGADGSDDCPSCVSIHEQRLFFANTNNYPQKVWGSVSGDYQDMTTGASDDDAVTYVIGSEQVNAIRWLSSGRVLMLGTLGGVFRLWSGNDELPLTPSNVDVKRETTYGTISVVPQRIGNFVYYVQRDGKTIRELGSRFDEQGFSKQSSFDTTVLAEHIVGDSITQMAYQQAPYNLLWCVRSDGQLACLTRQIDQEVLAWTRQILGGSFGAGDAVVESVAVIPGDSGVDEVWVVVKRTINSSTVRYVEYFKPFDYGLEQEDAFYVDSGLTLDSPKTITGITKANPGVVTAVGHGFSNGDIVIIRGVEGMTEVNRNKYLVAEAAADTFKLNDAGIAIDTYVKLLLHCDGTDGSTSFSDASASGHTVTAVGTAQVDTAYSKFGGASLMLPAPPADYLEIPDSDDWDYGTGDFTVDGWVRLNKVDTDGQCIYSHQNVAGLRLFVVDGYFQVMALSTQFQFTWAPAINTWYHFAVVRTGDVLKVFIDGNALSIQLGPANGTDGDFSGMDFTGLTGTLRIGNPHQANFGLDGWIDELRVSKGIARWTAAFTVPAEPYATSANVDTTDFTTYISGGEVRKCVNSVSGADHLAGETVDLLVDGIARDSAVVSAGGAVTIAEPTNGGGEIHLGLEYISTIKTMRIEGGSQLGTAQSKLKRIAEVFVRLYRSIKLSLGNTSTQDVVSFDATDDWTPEFTGDKRAPMPSLWDRNGYIVITQDGPLPMIISALIIHLNSSE